MELQIQDLVTSIRKEGVDAANAEADSIIAEARKKADAIISDAKAEAAAAKAGAEKEIGVMKESAAVSAEQAKRDAMLSFKTEVQKEYEKLLKNDIRKELSGAALGKLIRAALAGEDVAQYSAEVAAVSDELKAETRFETASRSSRPEASMPVSVWQPRMDQDTSTVPMMRSQR